MILKSLLAVIFISTTIKIAAGATDKVVCYWGTWSGYRWGNGKFTVNDINPNLCTHLIYGFVGINLDGSVKLLDEYLDVDAGNFLKFNALKEQNTNLKTLIAIGGWNEGSENYSNMAADPTKRANLINSALELVQKWGFDGFDLDWEYPNQRGGVYADIDNFATLIREFREEFDKYGLLVTAAVAAAGSSVDLSYDVPALSQYLDFINVMTYDLHGSWDEVTGQNAPLYASSIETDEKQLQLNVDAAIKHWISRGADPQKLVLGMGAYGRTYTLANSEQNQLGAAITGGGNQGRYTGERGFVGYHEIIELQNEGGWTVVWDDEQKTPYTYKENQWIGYDNPRSIAIKVEYAKSLNLGGVMVWSIDTDDFNGLSGTQYQLLTTINQALEGSVVVPEPEPETTSAPEPEPEPEPETTSAPEPEPEPTLAPEPEPEPEPETTSQPEATSEPEQETEAPSVVNPSDLCVQEGFVRDPTDCTLFYYCFPSSDGFQVINRKCNHGLVYDIEQNICNYASVVQC